VKAPKLGTWKWVKFRKQIMVRDLYQCRYQYAGCMGVATQVDHLHPRSWGGAWFDERNCFSVCHACHREKERRHREGEALGLFLGGEPSGRASFGGIPPRNTRYSPITSDYSRKATER
jgi:hypothetical protein